MQTSSLHRTLCLTTIGALTLTAGLRADDDKVKIKDDKIVVKTEDGKAKIDKNGNVLEVKGENGDLAVAKARAQLSQEEAAKFRASLVTGYTIPQDRYVYLDPVPTTYIERIPNRRADVEYRMYGDTIYAVNPNTYTVVDVIDSTNITAGVGVSTTTTTVVPSEFKASLVKGYTVPKTYYTYFQPVPQTVVTRLPAAPAGVEYRYYDGTVYSIDPNTWTIVDVVAY